jgi:hypothetical protein
LNPPPKADISHFELLLRKKTFETHFASHKSLL